MEGGISAGDGQAKLITFGDLSHSSSHKESAATQTLSYAYVCTLILET